MGIMGILLIMGHAGFMPPTVFREFIGFRELGFGVQVSQIRVAGLGVYELMHAE